ncbi:uncharacterized protein LOC128547057 isoform X2 [Mercenaria mercenaria]|uniref:uncharacterized protein LOC128547057 isoform X2 n=1 Tax=Mercenaria mercenaria TaxID=6596 RepID=UPI00234EE4E2|nr:uncharacterized protein LOC128547057 isoform X2 [Mercenaria mercenaria]
MLFYRGYCRFYLCLAITAIIGLIKIRLTNDRKIMTTMSSNLESEPDKTHTNLVDKGLNFKFQMQRLNAEKVNADDPALIELIKEYYIEKPSQLPYNLEHPDKRDPSCGQTAFVDGFMNHKEGGFYVDCGAHAGEVFSNSLFLERYRNWNGILIEANPTVYKELKKKNRKAFTLNACLNGKPYPSVMTFLEDSWWGYILDGNQSMSNKGQSGTGRYVEVQCFPLYSILMALNQTNIDYFSLDVEGAEEGVLDSIPWNKVDIRMMSIEYDKWPGGKYALKAYMEKRGYKFMTEVIAQAAADIIVLKED